MSDHISPEAIERRDAARFAMDVPVSTRERGSHQMPATLLDLSVGGCLLSNACWSRAADAEVFVRIPDLESLSARVAWSEGSRAGLAFERPLHPAVFLRITSLHRQGGTSRQEPPYDPTVAAMIPRQPQERPAGSRRDQIIAGYTLPDPGMLLDKRPAEGGKSIFTLVRRNTARNADHRHEPRFPAPLATEVRLGDRADLTVVANLSASGVMAEGDVLREIGDPIEIRFSGHEPILATVIWKRGRQFGLSLPPDSIALDAA